MKGCGETPLSMAIKAEAMRQINLRLDDHEQQNTSVTIASIAYLASGVWVRMLPLFLVVLANKILGLWVTHCCTGSTST
jgi:hypothetical protein